jgi:ribose transport system permease protein
MPETLQAQSSPQAQAPAGRAPLSYAPLPPLDSGWSKREFVARLQPLIALALMVAVLSIAAPTFRTQDNALNILREISVNLCLSLGMTLIILTEGIDLSVGAVLALSGVVAAGLLKNGLAFPRAGFVIEFTVSGAILVGILTGMLCGWVNGAVITRLGVPPFVATLGMLSAARGLTNLWTAGRPIPDLGSGFSRIGSGSLLGIPVPVWIAAVLSLGCAVVTRRTRFGRYIYAVGGNERAALLSGLPVARIKRAVYTLGGAFAGAAGLILTSRLDAGDPTSGAGYELDSIAAVVIGGTSLSGGRGSILGTVIGCLIIGVLNNGLILLNVSPFWQQVVKGVVIVVAVAIDRQNIKANR